MLRATGGYTLNCSVVIHFGERQVHAPLSLLVSAHAMMCEGSQRFCDLGRIHRVSSMAMGTLPTDGSFGKGKRGAHTSIPIERKLHTEPRAKKDTPQPWNMIPNRHFPLILGPAAAAGSSAVSPAGTEGSTSSSGHSLQLEEAPSTLYRLMFLKLRQEL